MCNHDGNHGNGDTQWKLFSEYCRLHGQESAQWKPWKQSVVIRGFQVRILARALYRGEIGHFSDKKCISWPDLGQPDQTPQGTDRPISNSYNTHSILLASSACHGNLTSGPTIGVRPATLIGVELSYIGIIVA